MSHPLETLMRKVIGTTPTPASGMYGTDGNYIPLTMGTGEHAAADTTAKVLRANYDEWKNKYFGAGGSGGVIPQLINQTTYANPNLVNEELDKGATITNNAFNVASANQAYQQQKYGMNQTAEQTASNGLAMDQAKAASSVDASNRIRQKLYERNQSIAAGGLPVAVSASGG